MSRRRLVVVAAFVCSWTIVGSSCRSSHNSDHRGASTSTSNPAAVRFVEISEQAGIHFAHNNGATGKKYMPETIGSGVAFLDYDNDGWQDILFVNSANWPGDKSRHDTLHLYHNNRNGTFTDVTKEAGLDVEMYGMGVAVGDYDNDGYEDIYVTCVGPNHLFHNVGVESRESGVESGLGANDPKPRIEHRKFVDVTKQAGVEGVPVEGIGLRWKWSSSAAWLDYDKDGKLDLFVCNYIQWSPETDIWCGRPDAKAYCHPQAYGGIPCTLYHNEGGGRFRDVSEETGIRGKREPGRSLGVAVADFNGDGWPDIAVANDTWPNFLFINQGGKRFVERGLESGVAFGESSKSKAGMGIDTADWNNKGRFGLLIGNFYGEALSLFENDGHAFFRDKAHLGGLDEVSLHFLTFGLFFFDYDLDGWPDALTANGHIDDRVKTANDPTLTYEERPLLFHNLGNGTFAEVGLSSGSDMSRQIVGRGAAYADIDNDGDLDFVLFSNGGRPLLYRNEGGNRNHWIRFRTVGTKSNRDGIGALIRVTCGSITQSQWVHSGGSYLSESQREPTFGLGTADNVDRVEILWPSGSVSRSGPLRPNRQYVVTEGQGYAEDTRIGLQDIKSRALRFQVPLMALPRDSSTPTLGSKKNRAETSAARRSRTRLVLVLVLGTALIGGALAVRSSHWLHDITLRGKDTPELEAAVQREPNDSLAQYYLAKRYYIERRFPDACKAYEEAVRLSPDDPRAHLGLGLALYESGNSSQAREEFERTLRLDDRSAWAEHMLGTIAWFAGDISGALPHMRRASELDPRSDQSWYGLSVCYSQLHHYSEAVDALRQALARHEASAKYHTTLGELLIYQNDIEGGAERI